MKPLSLRVLTLSCIGLGLAGCSPAALAVAAGSSILSAALSGGEPGSTETPETTNISEALSQIDDSINPLCSARLGATPASASEMSEETAKSDAQVQQEINEKMKKQTCLPRQVCLPGHSAPTTMVVCETFETGDQTPHGIHVPVADDQNEESSGQTASKAPATISDDQATQKNVSKEITKSVNQKAQANRATAQQKAPDEKKTSLSQEVDAVNTNKRSWTW